MALEQKQECDFCGNTRSVTRTDESALREGRWNLMSMGWGGVYHACPRCVDKMVDWAFGAMVDRPRKGL